MAAHFSNMYDKKTNQYFFGFSQIKLLSSICIAEKQLQSV